MGGRFKAAPEDFRVEELPAYLPSGEGEHLFLWVEKRALSTPQVASALAAELRLGEREVSYAGLKDRQAVARQWFCVPARAEAALRRMDTPQIRVLESKRTPLYTGEAERA